MDTPEQPTIWPPAPTVAPPEAKTTKPFKLKLALPDWANFWLKCSSRCGMGMGMFLVFIRQNFHFRPHWDIVIGMEFLAIAMGGMITAWKFRPRKKE